MLKIVKSNNVLHNYIDENNIIPDDFSLAQPIALETLGWITFMKISSIFNRSDKFSTVLHKVICLLFKVVLNQNPDLSNLTEKEQAIIGNIQNVININYTDNEF